MERLASVRFERVLQDNERDELARVLRSAGIAAGPWASPAGSGRTYALLRLDAASERAALAHLDGRVDEPALSVLEIVPRDPSRLPALADALGGPGAPAGAVDCLATPAALVLELDEGRTSLATVVDLVDVELQHAPGRRIVPLLGLSDERLAAFAAELLSDPELDASRLIETYSEALRPALRR